jgi:hypothetical protein
MIETMRFAEYSYYDPQEDRSLLRLQAITNEGTYFADVPAGYGAKLRERKTAFREYVLQSIALQHPPHEVTLG